MPVKAGYLFLTAGGVIFLWSGLRGKSVTGVMRAVIGGENPASAANANTVLGATGTTTGLSGNGVGTGGAGSGSAIAADALQYVGHPYVYGGPSNPNNGWDCSSFVSYVLGHDLSYALPGGTWSQVTSNGAAHGPIAAQYLLWSGASVIPRNQVQAGDLLCWQTHVGFAANNTQMISAYDPADGTVVTPINGAGPTAEVLVCKRVNGAS
jgi:cell wall-associated NlpC family hydrolase